METQVYNAKYNDEQPSLDYHKPDRKKKRHRKPREEDLNDEDQNNDYNGARLSSYDHYQKQNVPHTRRSEEENFDPSQPTRRKHHSQPKRREDEYSDEPLDPRSGRHQDNSERESAAARKPRKERKKNRRDPDEDVEDEDQHDDRDGAGYLNLNPHRSRNGGDRNDYQLDDTNNESLQFDDDEDNDRQQYLHDNESEERTATGDGDEAAAQKPKKKSGGFMKIFASFKSRGKAGGGGAGKQPKGTVGTGKQWQSNPEIFNPAYDSQPGTLERSSKKAGSKDLGNSQAQVILLDGMEVQFRVSSKMLGKELFGEVCRYLSLIETDFFGMTYVNSKLQTWFWLEMDKKISKQLLGGDEWIFNFQVKFYPPEPVLLQEDITRYLLSLQVRQDVFTGKLPCSWITQALLGSFMVQSELGDYDELEHGDGIDYLREFEFVLNQSDQLLEKIAELHKKHVNMAPDKADVKYLETAKRLEQYGVDLHPARDNDDVEIFIGVSYQGVLIYRDRVKIGRFAWPKVLRISYKKNYFYLKIRSDRYDDSVAIVGFKLFNHNLAKRLWKNAVEQHTFFRMKGPQMLKQMPRIIPTAASTYNYSGKTLHQYRSTKIARDKPLEFDRSLTKRRTIGSMPAGLDSAGIQYSSMHSLNRSHPRDMTLGKTKSIEYLSSRRPGSNIGSAQGSVGNIHEKQPGQYKFGGQLMPAYKDDDRHMSFQSGDSLNAADSYVARNDDQISLPSMQSHPPQAEYARPFKKKNERNTRPTDVLSDDGINSYPEIIKPQKKQNIRAPQLSSNTTVQPDNAIYAQAGHSKPQWKPSTKPGRPNDDLSDDDNEADNQLHLRQQPIKKPSVNDRYDDGYGHGQEPHVTVTRTSKKHSSRTVRPGSEDISDDADNSYQVISPSKPVKKHSSRTARPNDDLSDEVNSQQIVRSKPMMKQSSRTSYQHEDGSDDDRLVTTTRTVTTTVRTMVYPDPPVDTSQSEDLDPNVRITKKRSHQKPTTGLPIQTRSQPPNQFRPPPPPPEPIPQVRSNSSSERSSPMEHQLPPPPPPIIDIPQFQGKPKPPPVKPKPAMKPKPNSAVKVTTVVKKTTSRYDDASSNDDML